MLKKKKNSDPVYPEIIFMEKCSEEEKFPLFTYPPSFFFNTKMIGKKLHQKGDMTFFSLKEHPTIPLLTNIIRKIDKKYLLNAL